MKKWIHASSNSTVSAKDIADEVAQKYDLIIFTPKYEYILKGDSFIFKVNNHNVYRAIIDDRDNTLYLQCIAVAWRDDDGSEYYDEAVDYKDAVLDRDNMFDTLVTWVNECEADDPNYTEYQDSDGNPIDV